MKRRDRDHEIPITSLDELERLRKERSLRAKRNKARSKQHEREVATFLGGRRTPLSGALQYVKGDVTVELHEGELLLIECKMSAQYDSIGSFIVAQKAWLTKIRKEAAMMRATLYALIVKFHGHGDMYAFIPKDRASALHLPDPTFYLKRRIHHTVIKKGIGEFEGHIAIPLTMLKEALDVYRNADNRLEILVW